MVRKYDKFGYNRQFKINPCNRRDPFPRDHLPFIDDMSVLSELHSSGIGGYGPKMPQPITSRPIEQTPGSATPVYKPGNKIPGTIDYDKAAAQIASNLENSPNVTTEDVKESIVTTMVKEFGGKFGEDFIANRLLGQWDAPVAAIEASFQVAYEHTLAYVRDHYNKEDRKRDSGYSGGKFKGDDVFASPSTKPYSKRP